jgi:hypothetical protein
MSIIILKTGPHSVAQDGLELTVILPQFSSAEIVAWTLYQACSSFHL